MIITVATWGSQVGKSTVALLLARSLTEYKKKEKVFLIDYGKPNTLKELFVPDASANIFFDSVTEENVHYIRSEDVLEKLSETEDIVIIDLTSHFTQLDDVIFKFSDCILVPFVEDEKIISSTTSFANHVRTLTDNQIIFVQNMQRGALNFVEFSLENVGQNLKEPIPYDSNLVLSFKKSRGDLLVFKKTFEELYHILF